MVAAVVVIIIIIIGLELVLIPMAGASE
jgi:hypothetical protein